MDESSEIVKELDDFNNDDSCAITPILDKFIAQIASTGLTLYPWHKLKKLIARKMDTVISDFHQRAPAKCETVSGVNTDHVSFDEMKQRLVQGIEKFNGAPFTIQRLCELMINPTKHYKTTEKFMRGIEKNLLVVSTVDICGNKIVNEPRIHQDIEGEDKNLQSGTAAENKLFTVPDVSELNSSSARTSMTSEHSQNAFSSPSLPSSGLSNSREKKRRRADDEEYEDSPSRPEKYPSPLFSVDEEKPRAAPILGQLLGGDEDDHGVASSRSADPDHVDSSCGLDVENVSKSCDEVLNAQRPCESEPISEGQTTARIENGLANTEVDEPMNEHDIEVTERSDDSEPRGQDIVQCSEQLEESGVIETSKLSESEDTSKHQS